MPSITRMARALTFASTAMLGVTGCAKSADLRAPAIGAAAPAFSAIDLTGKPVSLAAFSGTVVVLNVWATWCIPCREEIPQLEALRQQYAGQAVAVIGVSVDGAGMGLDVRDFASEHGIGYAVWLDPDKQFALKFLTVGVPETFVIDRTGTIRWRMIGALRHGDTTLTAALRRALAE